MLIISVFINCQYSIAQITVDPPLPTAGQAVTVTFHADEGSKGLKDYTGDVYAHAGVLTDKSTSSSDWKYVKTAWGQNSPETKLTRLDANTYELKIQPSIKEYYGVPDNEKILKLAFVFRSDVQVGGQWKEGKTSTNGDIFYDVVEEGFQVTFVKPVSSPVIYQSGTINIQAASNQSATLTLYNDGTQISTVGNSNSISFDLNVNQIGNHILSCIGQLTNGTKDTATIDYVVLGDKKAELPGGSKPGLTVIDNNTLRFVLYAPGKQHVLMITDRTDFRPNADYQMNKTSDGNYFWLELPYTSTDQLITYQYVVDGTLTIADPYSVMVLDPWNDKYIEEATYPGLPPYPAGKTSDIVSAYPLNKPAYNWQTTNFKRPEKTNLVVYELLIRDYTEKHSYQSLTDTLAYLKRLGVNTIELMPVSEFEGNISWGYNVSFHGALDKYYGTPEAFKSFIDAAHAEGIAVVLDVVFNHAFGQSPLVKLYWDAQNNRPAANSPWFNPVEKHPYNVGYDFNHESPATQAYMDQVLKYWLDEYHVDGFRFDLSKGFTQVQSNDVNAWGKYDASRIAILKRVNNVIAQHTPGAYVILEHFAENTEEIELAGAGMMLWGNSNHDFNEATMGFTIGLDWTDYKSRGWTSPLLISYMESHDEERLMYKNLQFGNSWGIYSVKDYGTALNRIKAANVIFYSIPGPKMLWQFGEMGYQYSINYCNDGTVNSNCRTDPKPIIWNYLQYQERRSVLANTKDMIDLKLKYSAFRTTDYETRLGNTDPVKYVYLKGDTSFVAIANFDVQSRSSTITVAAGKWYNIFNDRDSIDAATGTISQTFAPGFYALYSNHKIVRPSTGDPLVATKEVIQSSSTFDIYPNPAANRITLVVEAGYFRDPQVMIYDIQGKLIKSAKVKWSGENGTIYTEMNLNDLNNGLYTIKLHDDKNIVYKKLVINK